MAEDMSFRKMMTSREEAKERGLPAGFQKSQLSNGAKPGWMGKDKDWPMPKEIPKAKTKDEGGKGTTIEKGLKDDYIAEGYQKPYASIFAQQDVEHPAHYDVLDENGNAATENRSTFDPLNLIGAERPRQKTTYHSTDVTDAAGERLSDKAMQGGELAYNRQIDAENKFLELPENQHYLAELDKAENEGNQAEVDRIVNEIINGAKSHIGKSESVSEAKDAEDADETDPAKKKEYEDAFNEQMGDPLKGLSKLSPSRKSAFGTEMESFRDIMAFRKAGGVTLREGCDGDDDGLTIGGNTN